MSEQQSCVGPRCPTKTIDLLRVELKRYQHYADVLDHLRVFEGGIPIENKIYNKNWISRGSRTNLNDRREYLARLIDSSK